MSAVRPPVKLLTSTTSTPEAVVIALVRLPAKLAVSFVNVICVLLDPSAAVTPMSYPACPFPDDAKSILLSATPLIALMRSAALSASDIPAVPMAILFAPSAGAVVALSSSKNVIASPPKPPALVGISTVNETSADEDSAPVKSIQSTAVAAVAVAIPIATATLFAATSAPAVKLLTSTMSTPEAVVIAFARLPATPAASIVSVI